MMILPSFLVMLAISCTMLFSSAKAMTKDELKPLQDKCSGMIDSYNDDKVAAYVITCMASEYGVVPADADGDLGSKAFSLNDLKNAFRVQCCEFRYCKENGMSAPAGLSEFYMTYSSQKAEYKPSQCRVDTPMAGFDAGAIVFDHYMSKCSPKFDGYGSVMKPKFSVCMKEAGLESEAAAQTNEELGKAYGRETLCCMARACKSMYSKMFPDYTSDVVNKLATTNQKPFTCDFSKPANGVVSALVANMELWHLIGILVLKQWLLQ